VRIAVIADIHANRAALEAVLEGIARARADRVVCLGDLVGYHAEPAECIELVRASAAWVVAGNHDRDVVSGREPAPGTNPAARAIQQWTRSRLAPEMLSYLAGLPKIVVDPAGVVGVHGCYLNNEHVFGYVTSTMLPDNLLAITRRSDEWPRVALCAHTHQPMCAWLEAEGCVESPSRGAVEWPAAARAVLVNPGSVGQPRDGDPRASFAVVDVPRRRVEFHRCAYDIERTARLLSEAGFPPAMSERLREGR
jgi:diadenosine tetraphosphatase ApaH/serine/threonine PP2A family protein phosphatase